jgi:glyoxylase-like metal-dependent hydrolase (beta-lactamase superfamily II)
MSNAYLIKMSGNNNKKSILVDTGSPGELDRILSILQKENIDIHHNISLIIHTHAHPDHAGNTYALKQINPEIQVATHIKEAEFLESGRYKPVSPTNLTGRVLIHFLKKEFKGIKPDIVIEDDVMDLGSWDINGKLVFTPGHTEGSISVVIEGIEEDRRHVNSDGIASNQAIAGDLMKGGHLGGLLFSNQPDYHYFAYDLNIVRSSIKKLMDFSVSKVYLGHGGPLDQEDIKRKFSKHIINY